MLGGEHRLYRLGVFRGLRVPCLHAGFKCRFVKRRLSYYTQIRRFGRWWTLFLLLHYYLEHSRPDFALRQVRGWGWLIFGHIPLPLNSVLFNFGIISIFCTNQGR